MDENEHGTSDPELRLLARLLAERSRVAGDPIEVDPGIWAIHGSIPVEGEVIMAEFPLIEEARAVLDRLGPNQP